MPCTLQLANKMTAERRNISQIHHTLNINTLSLLKNKAVEILRAFFLAWKRPVDGTRWIEENRQLTDREFYDRVF
jgi:hypothetical protein